MLLIIPPLTLYTIIQMKHTLSTSQVAHALMQDTNANRSYEEATALSEYYEEYEESTGEELELDVVAIRCERSSYTAEELYSSYDHNGDYEESNDFDWFIEHLQQSTTVIECKDSYLIMDF